MRTGDTVYGEAPGMGSASLDVSRQLSLVGSIPELGAWCLSRRVPVHQKPDLGTACNTNAPPNILLFLVKIYPDLLLTLQATQLTLRSISALHLVYLSCICNTISFVLASEMKVKMGITDVSKGGFFL